MKTMRYILYIIALLLVVAVIFGWYIGYFNSVAVLRKDAGAYVLAGREFTGPYSNAGKNIMQVVKELQEKGVSSTKSFGIYYDAPGSTDKNKYRSFVGGILEEKDYRRIAELRSAGIRIDSVTLSKSLMAEFPLKNSLSYMVAPMKVYQAMAKHGEAKSCNSSYSLEVYDEPAKKIIFIMPCNE